MTGDSILSAEILARSRRAKDETAARVNQLISSDRVYERDILRQAEASIAVANGNFAALQDSVISPTPEQLEKGMFLPYTADTSKHSAAAATTVRRVLTPHVKTLHNHGKISDEQFAACLFYRDAYERAGMEGKIKSAQLDREVFGGAGSGFMFTEAELDAQAQYRGCRSVIRKNRLVFFEMVVLGDKGIWVAAPRSPSGRHPLVSLRDAADAVYSKVKEEKWNGK
jgi:hypothetical protein